MQAAKKFSDAINLRPQIIRSAIGSKLTTLKTPGINPYTQVELHEKFGPCLPPMKQRSHALNQQATSTRWSRRKLGIGNH